MRGSADPSPAEWFPPPVFGSVLLLAAGLRSNCSRRDQAGASRPWLGAERREAGCQRCQRPGSVPKHVGQGDPGRLRRCSGRLCV